MIGTSIVDRVMTQLHELNYILRTVSSGIQTHAFWKNKICQNISQDNSFTIKVMGLDTAGITFQAEEDCLSLGFKQGETYFVGFNDKHPLVLRALRENEEHG